MRIEEIMKELSAAAGLPEEAIRAAVAQPRDSVPAFVAAIERTIANPAEDEAATAVFFIFHILGEIGAKEAYRPLTRLLQLPSERLDALLGDSIAETATRVMVGVFDGDPAPLMELVENKQADEMVRAQMLEALAVLARLGRWDRGGAEAYLHGLTQRLQPRGESFVWVGFEQAVAMLGMRELRPFVQRLHEQEWIDPTIGDLEDFDADLEAAMDDPDGPPLLWGKPFEPWEDTAEELRTWHSFSGEAEADEDRDEDELDLPDEHEPLLDPWRHVGRNDPCPCGSGKKFKKCCLPRLEAEGLL
ncbi:DUF1186 domain-containing protein [Benzoatithermus flavus]|uniref:DUF1186 domain-containing protein n=1 Tax=Benzoatithermus flavus TaxID=3108223 RepID=A0ABU8XRT3_9PROT